MSGADVLTKAARIAKTAADRKAEDLVVLDMRELASFADVFILATGTSDRHVRAIADAVEECALASGERPLGVEGHEEGRWILLDLGDVIVHVFQREVREHYDLERLWSEAPRLALIDPEAVSVTR
jgi:ribosome-associated protein